MSSYLSTEILVCLKQLNNDHGYDDFLVALMKQELDARTEGNRQRKIRTANFPYIKTIDELDCRFEMFDDVEYV